MSLFLLLAAAMMIPVLDLFSDDDDQTAPQTEDPEEEPRPSGSGTSGDDVIYTPDSYNLVMAGDGDDIVYGGDATDVIRGEAGDDTLIGGAGNDALYDTQGANVLEGGEGDDQFALGSGSTATGGEGADRFDLFINTASASPAIITDFTQGVDSLDQITIETDAEAGNGLSGIVWDDGGGIDLFYADMLVASISGGQEIDPSAIPVVLNVLGDTFADGAEDSTIRGFGADQTIEGGDGDDTISGWLTQDDTGADAFHGGAGNDVISVLGPSDAQYGLPGGIVTLSETPLATGGDGDDLLIAQGTAILTGGEGADTFALETTSNWPNDEYPDPTLITDFQPGEDVLYIEAVLEGETDQLTITVWDNGTGADVALAGVILAQVQGGQTMTANDIRGRDIGLGVDLLGHH